jgi:hypothetical protein
MIKIADERLNKVSHLTVKETATLLRLLQGESQNTVRNHSMSSQDRIDAFEAAVGFTSAPALHSQC